VVRDVVAVWLRVECGCVPNRVSPDPEARMTQPYVIEGLSNVRDSRDHSAPDQHRRTRWHPGVEYPHPGRTPAAGLVFYNDEGTETGGLIHAGATGEPEHQSGVHPSFDNFEQDQVVVLASHDNGPPTGSPGSSSSTDPIGPSQI
jgi:hypothetical protein